jgi:hypothetical protein
MFLCGTLESWTTTEPDMPENLRRAAVTQSGPGLIGTGLFLFERDGMQ